jgi:hypothetical protein
MPTEEREFWGMFLDGRGDGEIIWGPRKSPPPRPTRWDEVRLAAQHLREALRALRRAIGTA